MNQLPIEFFKDLTLMTIQKEARWMEFVEDMEDFQLQNHLDDSIIEELTLFLCGYIPQLDMELAIQVFAESKKAVFSSLLRGQDQIRQQEFVMADFENDFEMNMLVYAANTQILQREMEGSYQRLVQELVESKSGCAGCKGCH